MKGSALGLFVLLCGCTTFAKDRQTVSSLPDQFLIARHTFFDFGPPTDFYEIISVRGTWRICGEAAGLNEPDRLPPALERKGFLRRSNRRTPDRAFQRARIGTGGLATGIHLHHSRTQCSQRREREGLKGRRQASGRIGIPSAPMTGQAVR